MITFSGKIVWLTGASTGIGKALVLEMTRNGAIVAMTARSKQALEELANEIKASKKHPGQAYAYPGDVTSTDEMKSVAKAIENELGPVDILIANAGTHSETKPLEFDSAEYIKMMDINFGGVVRCIEAVLPSMLQRKKGNIVGIASLAGFRALPCAAAYGSTKSALIHFLHSIRFHLQKEGITVTTINPGFVKTRLTDKNDFHMPFLMEPRDSAVHICKAVRLQKKVYSFPMLFACMLRILQFLPLPLYDFIVYKFIWKQER